MLGCKLNNRQTKVTAEYIETIPDNDNILVKLTMIIIKMIMTYRWIRVFRPRKAFGEMASILLFSINLKNRNITTAIL